MSALSVQGTFFASGNCLKYMKFGVYLNRCCKGV